MDTTAKLIRQRYGTDTGTGTDAGEAASAHPTVAAILARRTHRRYTRDPVADSLLDVLLACAQSAPTKSNLQQYSIMVVSDPARRKALAGLCPQTPWLERCPVLLAFCADIRRGRRLGEMRGHPHRNNNLDTFLNAVVDAALAMQCFITAAEAAGLGCAPISEVRNRIAETCTVLGLPPGVFPVAGLTCGWPAGEGYINQRLPPDVVIHRDGYDDSRLEAEIAAYDARRHAVFPTPPEKQRHVDRYGALDFCGWSENAARQLSVPERAGFRDFLLAHGFALD